MRTWSWCWCWSWAPLVSGACRKLCQSRQSCRHRIPPPSRPFFISRYLNDSQAKCALIPGWILAAGTSWLAAIFGTGVSKVQVSDSIQQLPSLRVFQSFLRFRGHLACLGCHLKIRRSLALALLLLLAFLDFGESLAMQLGTANSHDEWPIAARS